MNIVTLIENEGSQSGTPKSEVKIAASGVL